MKGLHLLRVAWTESRFRLAAGLVVGLMAVSFLVRLVLLVLQNAVSHDGVLAVLAALGAGEVFDARAAVWVVVPFVLYLVLAPERWYRSRAHRAMVAVLFGAACFGILFVAVVEVFFFLEFNGRFNFVAVDYLMYPTEVVENIWESYPTGLVLALLGAVSIAVAFLVRKPLRAAWSRPLSFGQRNLAALAFAAVLLGLTFGVPASLAHVSGDRALNEIAANGYGSFWNALLGSDAPYAGLYATRDSATVFHRLRGLLAEPEAVPASFRPGSTLRHIKPLGPRRPLNVVVVLEESFGSEFVGTLHPRRDRPVSLTPSYDALSKEGLLFTHAYSTGNRTIRALEATTSSLPPLPGISIVRRPQSKDLFTLPALLRAHGYQTLFVYGGRALFDGMGGYLRANGVDRVVEQKDYSEDAFRTAWGVADESIFDRALTEMDAMHANGRPFYTLVLSVSNHRPYTFPEGEITWDKSLKSRENAVRYADWALGRFVRQARQHAFFKDTLFVLMGDHGARVYGSAVIPLPSYEVPILFYAPGVIPAGDRIDTLTSSLDIPPTVLGVLGMEYDSPFFGHDVLHIDPSAGRALMTHNNEIALMKGSRIAVLGLHRSAQLFDVRPDGSFVPLPRPDRAGVELIEDAISYYTGADTEYRNGSYGMKPLQPEQTLAWNPEK
ncbi:MAG TPA: LTA synthase family protein [Thermoanaerobaculia bacterium]|jgi:phosphoglycerol transferase MdoB-like AlkP superfamily enzyme|nr:LTA synthase family protein [Thermoanaerobaculia bacterium]